jgi:hypothetical protein
MVLAFAFFVPHGGCCFPPFLTFAKPCFIRDLDLGFAYWMSVVIVRLLSSLTPCSGLESTLEEDELALGLCGGVFGV